jgi:hypothetical protein
MTIHISDYTGNSGQWERWRWGAGTEAICGATIEGAATEVMAPLDDERLCVACRIAFDSRGSGLARLGGVVSEAPARDVPDGTFADMMISRAAQNAAMAEQNRERLARRRSPRSQKRGWRT